MGSQVLDILKIVLSSLLGGAATGLGTELVRRLLMKRPSVVIVVSLAVVGAVICAVVGYGLVRPTPFSRCPIFASTSVPITSPADGNVVPQTTTVEGTACNIPHDKELWLLVKAGSVSGYYPQAGPIDVSGDGKWSATALLGVSPSVDKGLPFALYTALADHGGRAVIQQYFAAAPNLTPLTPLPAGIQLIDQVTVTRQ